MKPVEVDVQKAKIVDGLRSARSGVHLSDILQYIRETLEKKFKKELSPEDFHRFKMGEGFEAGVMSLGLLINHQEHHEHVWRGYSFKLNGIDLTTDGVCLACEKCALVWEVKLTWFGTKKDLMNPVFRVYHYQLMAYVYALQLEIQKRVKGRFVFGYVNGNYTTKRKPKIRAWDCPYSEAELHSNWRMILRVLEEMKRKKLVIKINGVYSMVA